MIGKLYTKVGGSGQCQDATVNIVDSNGNPIGSVTVPSGGSDTFVVTDSLIDIDSLTWSVPATDGLSLSVVDTIGEVADTTKVGNDIVIEDRQYNIYVNGTLNQSFTAPAIDDLTININA